ncbi:MAG: SRPBCC domain-containing protein [Planctomycetaceae bacterium]|nr:SRPBCC domain-containing protein [Planctomycetaceae bacterium]
MKYMLLIYGAENCWTEPERESCMRESMRICEELADRGQYLASAPLHSVMTATSLQVRDGKRIITDGPFAETTEQLGGYYVIDVANLEEAIEIAGRLPPATKGTVEIRPIFDVSPLVDTDPRDIVTRRDLPFSCETVFAALEKPERLARWWGPEGFTNTVEEFCFQPGGEWKFVMHGPDGTDYDNLIRFEEIDAPTRIVFEHISPPRFRTTIELVPLSKNTTHFYWVMRFENAHTRDGLAEVCIPANEQNLDRLTRELSFSEG